jgi:hypothetical protein
VNLEPRVSGVRLDKSRGYYFAAMTTTPECGFEPPMLNGMCFPSADMLWRVDKGTMQIIAALSCGHLT